MGRFRDFCAFLFSSIHSSIHMYLVAVHFAVDGHMITCDRGQQGSSGVMSGLSTSCQPNHLFIFLTAKLGPALAGEESQKGKVRGERGGS